MSVLYTEEQLEFKKLMADFMRKEVEPYKNKWDEEGHFPLETYKKAFELGLHTLEIPEELGGAGLDHTTMAMIYEEAGYWDAGFGMTLLTSTVQPLKAAVMYGTREQQQMVADIIMNGGRRTAAPTPPPSSPHTGARETSTSSTVPNALPRWAPTPTSTWYLPPGIRH